MMCDGDSAWELFKEVTVLLEGHLVVSKVIVDGAELVESLSVVIL